MQIPVLDMKCDNFSKLFGEALEEYGFASIVNHSVHPKTIKGAYECAVETFNLPLEIKRNYETPWNGRQTGYTSFGVEHAKDNPIPDLKEFFHVYHGGHEIPTLFPSEVPSSKYYWQQLFRELEGVSEELCVALGTYLDPSKPKALRNMVRAGNSLLRILHYPEVEPGTSGERSAPHGDINFITLLVAATKPGLQVMTQSGEWIDVNNPPEAIVVNVGDMLQMHTFGRFRSATHRVVNPSIPDGSRYSCPFFVHPRSDVALVTAGSYLNHRLREIGLLK